jgi:cytochrome c-type biogenesis protein
MYWRVFLWAIHFSPKTLMETKAHWMSVCYWRWLDSLGPFCVGLLLCLVCLPCVGPTLGAAIAVASIGQDMSMAFLVKVACGIGTASALLLAAFVSGQVLKRFRPVLFTRVASARILLGYLLVVLGGMILVGLDKTHEIDANQILPD